jgi:pyroglutamyl-peptidase
MLTGPDAIILQLHPSPVPRRPSRTTGALKPARRAPPPGARVLVTAFEPFAGEPLNASRVAVQLLPARIAGARIARATLPTVFGRALEQLAELIVRERPTHVVAVGEAGGRAELSVERIAINIDDARLPDNAKRQPIDTPVIAGGPAAYFATLPIKAMVAAIRDAGLPAAVSNSAGTYVCNHVFYGLMHLTATRFHGLQAGFIHVPCLPAMSGEDIARGLTAGIAAAVTVEHGLVETGGREA